MPDPDPTPDADGRPVTLDRRDGPYGEVVLRRRPGAREGDGDVFEIIANGTFLMDTSDGRSERLLIDAAQAALAPDRRDGLPSVLIGGSASASRSPTPPPTTAGAGSWWSSASRPSSTGTTGGRSPGSPAPRSAIRAL